MPTAGPRFVEVAVLAPVAGTFTYAVPDGMTVVVGTRVWVRFASRGVEGVVAELCQGPPPPELADRIQPLRGIVDAPSPQPEQVALARWVWEYYLAPPGEAARLILPTGGRAKEARRVALTPEGQVAAAAIGQALEPAALDGLALRERVVLTHLRDAGGEQKVAAIEVEGARAALTALAARGLVAQASTVKARTESSEVWCRFARAPTEDEPGLARSPGRRAIVDRLRVGEAPLAELRALDPRATAHLRALALVGLVATRQVVGAADAFAGPVDEEKRHPPELTPGQKAALARIAPSVGGGVYTPFLLHGVTGSGKTEVYLHVIALALAAGHGALALVPEISLTPQLAARFRARFGDEVAVLHSGLGERERFDAWARLAAGRVRIALGARSAVFAPVPRLGVVVIDEEHDPSFKQEDGVRYNGRDVAMRRARDAGAVAILGSATPALETYEAARAGRVALLELPDRATARPLPTVELLDLRQHVMGDDGLLSAPLSRAVEETLAAGEQVILFLNRRGFSTFVLCSACGHRFSCRDCAVTLTYHRGGELLACHYCGYLEALPSRCPKCQSKSVERLGMGTERVEEIVARRFPKARVARLDRDAARGRGMQRVLDGLRARTIDLVVGTQMITKGHDFPGVTLVGVLLADLSLGLPDFRATERTFQLLEQVAGRAGRGERPGRVLIQTYKPEEPAVARVVTHDYIGFLEDERLKRQELRFPPSSRLGLVRIDGADPQAVTRVSDDAAARARAAAGELLRGAGPEAWIEVLGPVESPIARLRGRTRRQLLVKAEHPRALRGVLAAAERAGDGRRDVRVIVDVDPVSML